MSPATPKFERIAFVASPIPEACEAIERLTARYGNAPAEAADVIVALGGDGLMLQTLHRFMSTGKPIYGMQHPGDHVCIAHNVSRKWRSAASTASST